MPLTNAQIVKRFGVSGLVAVGSALTPLIGFSEDVAGGGAALGLLAMGYYGVRILNRRGGDFLVRPQEWWNASGQLERRF